MKMFQHTPKQIGYWNTVLTVLTPVGAGANGVLNIHHPWLMALNVGIYSVALYWGFCTAHVKGHTEATEFYNERLDQILKDW